MQAPTAQSGPYLLTDTSGVFTDRQLALYFTLRRRYAAGIYWFSNLEYDRLRFLRWRIQQGRVGRG